MGWNGSGKKEVKTTVAAPTKGGAFTLKFLIALVILAGGVALAFFLLRGDKSGEGDSKSSDGHGLIKEVEPAKPKERMVHTLDGELITEREYFRRKEASLERQREINRQTGWTNGVYYSKDPGYEARRKQMVERDRRNTFLYHESEACINILVTCKPGEGFDPMTFDEKFKNDFIESLKEPIIVKHDDPPDIQEAKRAVIDAKIYLKQEMDAGRDICEIMRETQKELIKAQDTWDDFRVQLSDLKRKEGVTEQEIEDFVNAANVILDDLGGAKLKMPMKVRKWQLKQQGKQK